MEKLSLQVTCLKGWRTSATRNVCLKIQGRRIPTYTKTTLCISSKRQVKKIRCQFSVQHVGPTDYSMIISVHTIGGCKWVVSNFHMTLFGALGVSQTTSLSADSASDPLEFTCCDLHGIRLGAKRVTGFALNLCRKIPPCPPVMICAKKKRTNSQYHCGDGIYGCIDCLHRGSRTKFRFQAACHTAHCPQSNL